MGFFLGNPLHYNIFIIDAKCRRALPCSGILPVAKCPTRPHPVHAPRRGFSVCCWGRARTVPRGEKFPVLARGFTWPGRAIAREEAGFTRVKKPVLHASIFTDACSTLRASGSPGARVGGWIRASILPSVTFQELGEGLLTQGERFLSCNTALHDSSPPGFAGEGEEVNSPNEHLGKVARIITQSEDYRGFQKWVPCAPGEAGMHTGMMEIQQVRSRVCCLEHCADVQGFPGTSQVIPSQQVSEVWIGE